MKLRIAHEAPLAIMNFVHQYTDYDYALAHLVPSHPAYIEYFQRSRLEHRAVYLDNGAFELGTSISQLELLQYAEAIGPTHIFIPDVINDTEATLDHYRSWCSTPKHSSLSTTMNVGVVQGISVSDAIRCYQTMTQGTPRVDMISISFNGQYLRELASEAPDADTQRMIGRIMFIQLLIQHNIWRRDIPVHLLGVALPQELCYYKNIDNIVSIDTSSPVMAALQGLVYTPIGIHAKPIISLGDVFDVPLDGVNKTLLNHNLVTFRKLVRGHQADRWVFANVSSIA